MSANKYSKKPVVIEAIEWTGYNKEEMKLFAGNSARFEDYGEVKEHLLIKTLEGIVKVSVNDYIIKGINGEYYPCKPDIFSKTYEQVATDAILPITPRQKLFGKVNTIK